MSLLHLYSPSLCALCEREIVSSGVCDACRPGLSRLDTFARCPVCFQGGSDQDCSFCKSRNIFFDSCQALYALDEIGAQIIRKLKFENERWLIRLFTDDICRKISAVKCDRIGWISSGTAAHRIRPYQPVGDLALAISERTGIPGGADLMKIRNRKQSSARYGSRFFDLPQSLRLTESFKTVEQYILLEDIFTTGATANESARLLKKAGVKEVHVISLFQRQRDGLVWTPSQETKREKSTSLR